MRKLITGAVIASASLALTGGAIAQQTLGRHHDPRRFGSPKKVGTNKKPKSVTLNTKLTVNRPGTTVEIIELGSARASSSAARASRSARRRPDRRGHRRLPVGLEGRPDGHRDRRLEPGDAPLDFEVYPVRRRDANTFLFYLNGINGIGMQTPSRARSRTRAARCAITIPLELRQPAGLDATLTSIDQTFTGKSGKNAIVSSTNCKNGKHKVTRHARVRHARDGTAVPAPESLTEKVKCSK